MNPQRKSPEGLPPLEEMSYELALNELETIILDLEAEGKTLEQALAMFERGQALARHCARLLEKAELKVQALTEEGLVDFNPDL
ncbi:MAG: exodeoxyribonuclease VII small subunit [Chloroflexota bacterium]|nr:MAG: exodeoxyribonuclease VII small subunit [Chloroflexota bacterium]